MTEWGPAVREYETLKVEADRHPTMKGYIDIDVADDAIAELKVQLNVVRLDRDGQRKRAEAAEAEVERLNRRLRGEQEATRGYVHQVERLTEERDSAYRAADELLKERNCLKADSYKGQWKRKFLQAEAELERLTWMLDEAIKQYAWRFANLGGRTLTIEEANEEVMAAERADLARRWEQGADDRAADAWLGGEPH